MKNSLSMAGRLACVFVLLFLTNGCMKDKITRTYQMQIPIYETLTQARSAIKTVAPTQIQNPGKICTYKNILFVNEYAGGIHVIDNSDPTHPQNIAFINIPGSTDISVKDDILYTNEYYGDLVAFDISDPAHATAKKYIQNVFYSYSSASPDSTLVVVGYQTKDTTIRIDPDNQPLTFNGPSCPYCSSVNLSAAPAPGVNGAPNSTVGTNGSTSGFGILGNYLYALSYGAQINVIDISTADDPEAVNRQPTTDYCETIFPFENKLFLGSYNGMYIYDLSDPSTPVKQGGFAHVRTCDPVIADGKNAYVTLRSGTPCVGYTNELEVLDISDLSNPSLVKVYQLTNPRGLSKDGDLLFICDGKDGLKIYNAGNVNQLSLVKTVSGFESNDVISKNGRAIVLATDGLYQFDYTDTSNIHQLSKIDIHAL